MTVGFSKANAERIARTVRAYERDGGGPPDGWARMPACGVLRVIMAGRRWNKAEWTGRSATAHRFLKVPFDGVTAPSYQTAATYDAIAWDTVPADSSDPRADALWIDLARTPGPDFYDPRS